MRETLPPKETVPTITQALDIMDLRSGHFPGVKTPPWGIDPDALSIMKQINLQSMIVNPETITSQKEQLIAKGSLDTGDESISIDIIVTRDDRHGGLSFRIHPEGKRHKDFWNEDGAEIK